MANQPERFYTYQVYRQYRSIIERLPIVGGGRAYSQEEQERITICKLELKEFGQDVGRRIAHYNVSVFDRIKNLEKTLMLWHSHDFERFYNYVFFLCRDGQNCIAVSQAIRAWRYLFGGKFYGKFTLLEEWLEFVDNHLTQRLHENTWKQVLVFSKTFKNNFDGYELEDSWAGLIDEFVVHMRNQQGLAI